MSNITNAIFNILSDEIDAAPDPSILFGAKIHGDSYEVFEQGLTIRVGDVFGSQLQPSPDTIGVTEENALLDIHVVVTPPTDDLADRLAARETADSAAREVARILWTTQGLGGYCMVGRIFKRNDWIMPATIRMPVTNLRVEVNPR